ncbi:2-amino-4-hydroxy-6-hydroxymethyldihydropteridine diphosphokinase [Nocardiopsis sp. CNT-189]|uniref:2-amino-4-hydroxy-6- hydroxymethyldihydropteridine diphosphokinase n=1 Tax=Nocardiopsis oceanisediminis TaxID=2816862 RepID=UPI003B39A2F0
MGPAGTRRAVLALGGNIGDRMAVLQGAVDALFGAGTGLRPVAISPVYETEPVGGPEQGRYLNAVAVADCSLEPGELLALTQRTEQDFHRVREVRWGPRTLDVDVIALGGEISDDPDLTLPHPRAHRREFVLRPWSEADPGAVLPGRGPVADLLRALGDQGVRRRDDLELHAPGSAG